MKMDTNKKGGMPRYLNHDTGFTSGHMVGNRRNPIAEAAIAVGAKERLISSWWILLSLLAACTMNSLSWLETPRLTRL